MNARLVLAAAALLPALAGAQGAPAPAPTAPAGVVASVDLGGGGILGHGTQYTPSNVLEAEVAAGYELPLGIRPELGLALGVSPRAHVALRPGVHVDLPDLPLYARAALDWSSRRRSDGTSGWRWLMVGGGALLRLTDVLGAFAEADLGLPLASATGVGVLVRVGASFRM